MTSDDLTKFQSQRGRMFGIAYRMLGSASEAEDVVQDAWLRWQAADRESVTEVGAYLAKVVTNLCLTVLDSARVRRETYPGPWLPEPVLTTTLSTKPSQAAQVQPISGQDAGLLPLDDIQQRDTVSLALLSLLERLSPAERAVYVLREAFAYSPRDIATILDLGEANVRQLHTRARKHVTAEPIREVDRAELTELVEAFLGAARRGDLIALEHLLAEDIVTRADGGGIVNAARRPVFGRDNVARYTLGVIEKFGAGVTAHVVEANGQPAVLAMLGEQVSAVWFLQVRAGQIDGIQMVVNPEKLRFVAGQLSQIGGTSGLSM